MPAMAMRQRIRIHPTGNAGRTMMGWSTVARPQVAGRVPAGPTGWDVTGARRKLAQRERPGRARGHYLRVGTRADH
jgi:hypothetical protein